MPVSHVGRKLADDGGIKPARVAPIQVRGTAQVFAQRLHDGQKLTRLQRQSLLDAVAIECFDLIGSCVSIG
ncbi:hypothetical protein CI15_24470 [Paraburkholderia monticola]|uniref:Uncharacterized protein n=1 Tax=Paraburkholderia monticola TaxID=1399968 RepID=A0A149PFC7_9BURK|nr:hypothetical protein CI15_24470 [Paraburkholderia monticola]